VIVIRVGKNDCVNPIDSPTAQVREHYLAPAVTFLEGSASVDHYDGATGGLYHRRVSLPHVQESNAEVRRRD
jgi:hypothetical protein